MIITDTTTEPTPAVLADARATIEEGEFQALKMTALAFRHADNTEHRFDDLQYLRRLAELFHEGTTTKGAMARQLLNLGARVVDLEDQLSRFLLVTTAIVRYAGLDLDEILADFERKAEIVAIYGESDDFVPAAKRFAS